MACHACGLHYPNACEVCSAIGDLSECGGLTRDGKTMLDDLVDRVEQHQRDVWTQTREGRYSAWRALLARDVAEVERESRSLDERSIALAGYVGLYRSQAKACLLLIRIDPKAKNYKRMLGMRIGELTGAERGRRWVDRRNADCQAWLTRARAVLDG